MSKKKKCKNIHTLDLGLLEEDDKGCFGHQSYACDWLLIDLVGRIHNEIVRSHHTQTIVSQIVCQLLRCSTIIRVNETLVASK
ncbi:hypothetical protein GDO86_015302 [Hymenochirus boettgeri]|uniref:Uncharacterized protein n=1 Tax=Hymenochirus boettgeri TaxID=247094 RepID=A0A8T2JXC6_9PIPI|nr:hypothetical protein GDO86_015302 [Hymenochirus boettgeri]